MSGTSTINGTAGGLLQDTTGNTYFNLGSQPASIIAGLGTDTIHGGSGNIAVFASNDPYNIDMQGGAGTLAVSLLFGSGNATISGGTAGETVTGGLGNIVLTQAGALTLHPSNGTIDITADGQAITVWASDNSGYEVFTPTAGTTVIVAPTPDGFGHTLVTIGNSQTVALGNGFDSSGGSIAYLEGASPTTAGNAIIADPATPVLAGLSNATNTGLGNPAGINITTDTQPDFTGSAVADDEVLLYMDGYTQIGESVANAQGAWTIAASEVLTGGTHTITAEAVDISGVQSNTSNAYTVIIDTSGPDTPSITGLDPSTDSGTLGDSITNVRNVEIDGTSDPYDDIVLYDGTTSIGSTISNAAGSWSVTSTVALADGAHSLTAVPTDMAGLTGSASNIYVVTIETTPPPAPTGLVLDPASDSGAAGGDLTNVTAPTIDGAALPDETIVVSVDGTNLGTVTANGSGDWSFTVPTALAAGTYAITAVAVDDVGNVSTAATLDITIETIAAAPIITGAAATSTGTVTVSDLANTGYVTLTGTATQGATLVVIDNGTTLSGSVVANGSGVWSDAITVQQGLNTLTAEVISDAAGNAGPPSAPLVLTAFPSLPTAPSITGLAGGGSTTVSTLPTFTGTGLAEDTVALLVGGTVVATGTVNNSGTWSVAVTTPLADGASSITADEYGPFGHTSAASPSYSFTIEAIAAPTLDAGSQSGSSTSVTSITTPKIDGVATADAIIALLDNGSFIETSAANAAGDWSVTPASALMTGANTLVADVVTGGVTVASMPFVLTIETSVAAPAISSAAPTNTGTITSGNQTNAGTVTISGTAEAGATIVVADNLVTASGSVVVGAGGTWTDQAVLSQGVNSITATIANDPAGNHSTASAALVLTADLTAPAAPVILGLTPASDSGNQGDNRTDIDPLTLTGTGTPGDTVTLDEILGVSSTRIIGTGTVGAGGTWFVSGTIDNSNSTIVATQSDSLGNTSSASANYNLQIVPVPQPPRLQISGSSTVSNLKPTITVTDTFAATDTITIDDNGSPIGTLSDLSAPAAFTPISPLILGLNTITAIVTDQYGDISSASTLTLDITSAPTTLTLDPGSESGTAGSNVTNISTPKIDGTATGSAPIIILDNGASIGTATANAAGAWTFTPSTPLGQGANTLTAVATLGSSGSVVSSPLVLTIETAAAAPVITGAVPVTGTITAQDLTNAGTITLSGTTEQGATIVVMDGTSAVGTVVASSGNWSDNVALILGENTLTAIVSHDAAGNASAASVPLVLDAFAPVPAAPTITGLALASESGTPGDNRTDVVMPTFVGTGTAGDIVTLMNGSTVIATGTIGASGTWSLAASTALPISVASTITAKVTDQFGTASSTSSPYTVTIDPVPAQPGIALAAGSTLAATTQPAFTITSGDGLADSFTIYDNGTQIGSLSAPQSSDPASFTPISPLLLGLNTITAIASNAYGDLSNAGTVVITVQPAAPMLDPGSDSGVLGDDVTNVLRPQIDGTAVANGHVTILDNGATLGSTTANASGAWTYTPGASLTQGANTLVAVVVVGSGNTVDSAPLDLTIVTSAPAPAITGVAATNTGTVTAGDLTNTGTVTLSGTAEQGATIMVIDNGITLAGSAVANGSGIWSEAVIVQQGFNTLAAYVSNDFVGNHSTVSAALVLTAYPAPPTAPAITGLAAADTGGQGGSNTAIDMPTLTGTGLAEDTISLLLDDAVIGTGTVAANGTFSVGITTTLPVGPNTITAEASDPFGHTSAASAAATVAIVPVSAPSLDAASQSGSSISVTNHTTPRIDGVATPNAGIVLLDNGGTIATTVANGSGTWSVVPSAALAGGGNTLVAMVGVSNGVTVASAPFVLTIETSAAAPSIALAPASDSGPQGDNLTKYTTPTLTGTAAADGTITLSDNGSLLGTATASAGGVWSYTPTSALQDGANAITGVVEDVAGNISATTTLDLTIETSVAAPSILSFTPNTGLVTADNDTGASIITLDGTAAPGSNIEVFAGGTEFAEFTSTTGQWSVVADPSLGANTYTAQIASDPAGNTSPVSSAFVVTRLAPPPAPTIAGLAIGSDSGPAGDDLTNVTRPAITGTGTAGDLLTLENAGTVIGSGTVASNGTWSVTSNLTLGNGVQTLTATLTDAADNVSAASNTFQFTIDTTRPSAPTLALNPDSYNPVIGGGSTDDRMPDLDGTAGTGDLITVSDGSIILGTTTASAGGTWSLSLQVPLPIGAQTITATATDDVGNISAAGTLALTITNVPTATPTLTLAPASDSGTPGDQITNVTEPELIGSAPAGDRVVISANSSTLGTVVATVAGIWTFTPATPLSDGDYLLQATATDPLSGDSTASLDYTLQIDTVAPAAPVVQEVSGAVSNDGTTVVNSADPAITGTAPDDAIITLWSSGSVLGTTTAAANGTWSLTPASNLVSGAYALTATATDDAGNVSAASAALDISVQLAQPLAIDSNAPYIAAASQSIQQIFGPSWWLGGPTSVTSYSPGETPSTPASGSVLALSITDANDDQIVDIPDGIDVVTNTADGAVTLSGTGGNQLVVSTGSSTLFFSNGGSGVYMGNIAADGSTAPAGNNVVVLPNSGGGNYVIDTGAGNDTIFAGSGDDSIATGAGNNWVSLGNGSDYVMDTGNDTLCGGTGTDIIDAATDTISGSGEGVLMFGQASNLSFVNGSGTATIVGGANATVFGGSGSVTTWGASGSGIYFAGSAGNNLLVTGTGATTLAGGSGGGDVLVAIGGANNVLAAGSGYEILTGGDATGNNTYFSGSGSTAIIAGQGDDTVSMGSGTSTVFSGANTLIYAGGPGIVVASSGHQTIVGGGPLEIYGFSNTQWGGTTFIENFNPTQDHVDLWGYAASDLNAALAGQTNNGQGAAITLSDGTHITFVGVQRIDSSAFSV